MGLDSKNKKRPRDTNKLAWQIVQEATGQVEPVAMATENKKAIAGRKGGLKGGRARAKALSAERKTAIAKKAANTRWKAR